MKKSIKYRIVFDKEGKVYYSDAPFFTLKNECLIGDYLPLFSDSECFEELARNPLHPYEFSVEGEEYYVDFDLKKTYKNDELYYDLSINNRTKLYQNFQLERTEKNSYKIKFEEARAINKSLKQKLIDIEDMITHAMGNEMRTSVVNVKNSLKMLNGSNWEEQKKKSMFGLIIDELENVESLIEAFSDINNISSYSTFEECYYCGNLEIMECVENSLKAYPSLNLDFEVSEEFEYFLNKFHISNILVNAIVSVATDFRHMPCDINVSTIVEQDKGSHLGFYIIIKNKTLDSDTTVDKNPINLKNSEIRLLKAQKLMDLYGGSIKISTIDEAVKRIELTFERLLFKKA